MYNIKYYYAYLLVINIYTGQKMLLAINIYSFTSIIFYIQNVNIGEYSGSGCVPNFV